VFDIRFPAEVVNITGVTIRNANPGFLNGGGIYNEQTTLTLTNSTVSGNTANIGGGIYNLEGTLTLTNVTLSDNIAEFGGGLSNDVGESAAVATITNSAFSGNTAEVSGGIDNFDGAMTLNNSTVSGTRQFVWWRD
jgi:hypothetical protein